MEKYKNVRQTYVLILITMCLISFGLGIFVFSKFHIKEVRHIPINDSITINVKPLEVKNFEIKNSYIGHTLAINEVDITPFVSGYLNNIIVKEGDFVKKGELLVTIEPKEYEAKLKSSEAILLQTLARLEYNKSYYDRIKKSKKNSFSQIQKDEAKNNFLEAEANFKNAVANKMLAEINYGYTIIKSPISGKIGNFNLSVGDFVSPENGGIINIIQTNPIRVVFSLSDTEYFNIFNDSTAPFKDSVIKIKTTNGKYFDNNGVFKYTDNQINAKTNSLAIYADFENNNNILLPNTFVTVDIFNNIKNAISIDKNLVKMTEKGNFINIARNDKIVPIFINILAEENNIYIIKNDFDNGDLLILDDVSNIKDGTKLNFNIIK